MYVCMLWSICVYAGRCWYVYVHVCMFIYRSYIHTYTYRSCIQIYIHTCIHTYTKKDIKRVEKFEAPHSIDAFSQPPASQKSQNLHKNPPSNYKTILLHQQIHTRINIRSRPRAQTCNLSWSHWSDSAVVGMLVIRSSRGVRKALVLIRSFAFSPNFGPGWSGTNCTCARKFE